MERVQAALIERLAHGVPIAARERRARGVSKHAFSQQRPLRGLGQPVRDGPEPQPHDQARFGRPHVHERLQLATELELGAAVRFVGQRIAEHWPGGPVPNRATRDHERSTVFAMFHVKLDLRAREVDRIGTDEQLALALDKRVLPQ